jgi:hypothetical protein
MDREYQAHEFFCVNTEFQALICHQCQYAVRRSQVKAHLISTVHRIPSVWAERIQVTIQEWDHIQDEPQVESWPRQIDEPIPTPWLNRTGWVGYLQGTPRQALFESTQRPADDAEGPERAMLTIWEAMGRLATVSQEIAKACGHLLRIDVARTMKDESPHKPLLAYLDTTTIKRHVQPWQEIMMFFARRQVWFPFRGYMTGGS